MKKINAFIIIIVGILGTSSSLLTTSQEFDPYYPFPIVSQLLEDEDDFLLTPSNSTFLFTKNIIPNFSSFDIVTFAELLVQYTTNSLLNLDITLTLNGFPSTYTYRGDNFGDSNFLIHHTFLMDDKGKMIFNSPMEIKILFEADFKERLKLDNQEEFFEASIKQIRIVSVPIIESPSDDKIPLPVTTVAKKTYSSKTTSFFVIPATIETYIILPKNLNSSHYLNFTIVSNVLVEYTSVGLIGADIHLQQSLPRTGNHSNEFSFRVFSPIPIELTYVKVRIEYKAGNVPPSGIIFEYSGIWYSKLTNPNVFDPDEYDVPLFIASSIIPLLFLIKMPFNRSFKEKKQ